MKTLPDRKNLAGELIPIIYQITGPEKWLSEFIR